MARNTGDETAAARNATRDEGDGDRGPRVGALGAFGVLPADLADLVEEAVELEAPPEALPAAGVGEGDFEKEPPGAGEVREPAVDLPPASDSITTLSKAVTGLAAIAALGFVVVALAARSTKGEQLGWPDSRWWAATFATTVMCVFLGLLHATDRKPTTTGVSKGYGIFRPVIGGDRRWSTSLTQLALWTMAVGLAFAFLVGRVMFEGVEFDKVIPGDRWDEYLLLLGGPFAAAVLAKGLVTFKMTNGTLQKTEPAEDDRPKASQIVTSDDGGSDLVDAQYLLFNIVALGYFVIEFVRSGVLPEMPSPLLALTGGAAALYTANKAATSNPPTITAVTPRTATWGDTVTVFGSNFVPSGDSTPNRQVTVTISGCPESIATVEPAEATKARFRIPVTAAPGQKTLMLTSASGVQTAPQDLEIRANDPVLTGLAARQSLRPGRSVTVTGRNLGSASEIVKVTVAAVQVPGQPGGRGTTVTFDVPDGVLSTETSTTVKVSLPNRADAEIVLPVERPRLVAVEREPSGTLLVRLLGAGAAPVITVNDRAATSVPVDGANRVIPPDGVDPDGELRVRVGDETGRMSDEVTLPAVG